MKNIKKLLSVILTVCMALSLLPMTALAVVPPSGSGWAIDVNGQLTIGTSIGMYDWCSQSSTHPDYKALVKSVVILDDGVADSSDVVAINGYAFSSCTNLTSVTIPATVMEIGDGAFATCTSLVSVALPAFVQSIGSGAFFGCTSLASVTLPASVTTIKGNAFGNCKSLINVIFQGSTPPSTV